MKYLSPLPWKLVTDNESELDAALYQVDESGYKCEYQDSEEIAMNQCHPAPFGIGTSDPREPKFCLTHYFEINNATAETATGGMYQIVPLTK